ncbi:hypothetical protein BCR33DRAFT_712709 [Rhizoclosmatium globosum]|uniref:Uncharacterized protein n=1 Tax=Rhizoclosmatium globosum TaxID=329046 RepID=A0A1Y2CUM5_9FUNG|nr:hypothetical protein BCR33DRAFT_712709 [Rhizoclosmatium globosum]|eukprot:ORY50712.1 hypothetical protein BCR33DRAFT_712709 [Rhizoclosmatium globosum]
MLPNLIGHQAASRLLLTGDLVSAQKAKELGLVLSVHDSKDLFQDLLVKSQLRVLLLCVELSRQ